MRSRKLLADLYDSLTMPKELAGALGRTVDRLFQRAPFVPDANGVVLLFRWYRERTQQ